MKKSRTALKTVVVLALAVILIVLCVSAPTFAWFERPKSKTGGSLSLNIPYGDKDANGNTLSMKAYDGKDLTMETFLSTDDAISFSETPAPPATNVSGLQPGHRNYYKTEITNSGSTEQKVALFIKNFHPTISATTNICVGVNYPIKAFKNYSTYNQVIPPATKNAVSNTVKRVYFEPIGRVPSGNNYDAHRTTWGGTTFYVKSGSNVDSNVQSNVQMTRIGTSGYYYADIPVGHNQLYFSTVNNPANYQRTQTFTNLNGDGLSQLQSLLFYTNGTYTDYNNAWAGKENVNGACFVKYFNSVSISVGQTISVALTSGTDYCGSSISYSSSNTGIFTVSNSGSNKGTITAVAEGSATLTYTITSSKGETATKTANVVVHGFDANSTTITNAPIVTNLTVPANGKTEVWWFIQNGDDEYFESTADASYTLEGIFLSV